MNSEHEPRLSDLVKKLTSVLFGMEEELQKVRNALRSERQAFVSSRVEVLEEAVQRLETAASRCFELDARRLEILGEIGGLLGIHPSRLNSRKIAKAVFGPEGKNLVAQAMRTGETAGVLEVERRVGDALLEWSAHCHENLIRSLGEATGTLPKYGREGKKEEEQQMQMLDTTL